MYCFFVGLWSMMFMSMRSLAQHNSLPCIKVWPSSMISKNLLLVGLSIVLGLTALFVCCFETRKVLGLVRHMQATINGSLQSSPHPVTHASTANANIKDALERPLLVLFVFNMVLLTI